MRTIILGIAALVVLPSVAQATTTIADRDITVSSGPQTAYGKGDTFAERAAFWSRYADTRGAASEAIDASGSNAAPPEIGWDHVVPGVEGKLPGLIIDIPATAMPEPQVWAMMVMGLALVGGVLRRSARTVSFA